MNVYYSDMGVPDEISGNSLFLAGPSPRDDDVPSWRVEAVEILMNEKFDGEVYIPERVGGWSGIDYMDQVEWEHHALDNVGAIVFWVPRDIGGRMPAFTTNVEFGMYVGNKSKKVAYGRPDWAEKVRYLDYMYDKERPYGCIHTSLEGLLKDACGML